MIRAKTKRRVVLLLVAAVAGAVLLGGAYAGRRAYLRSQAFRARDAGLAAAKAGDYENALPSLYRYCHSYPNDADVLYYYALARQSVPEADGGNLGAAMRLWRQYLDLKPDDLDARHRLMDLVLNLGQSTETLDESEHILKAAPDDPPALRAKAIALTRLRKFPEALAAVERLNQAHPEDIENQLLALSIRAGNGATPEELVAITDAMVKAHPNDSEYTLLHSIAQANARDLGGAIASIRQAVASPTPNAKTTRLLLNQLDLLDLHNESLAVARTAATEHPDDLEYLRILAFRLFVTGDYDQVDACLKDVARDDPKSDPQLLALMGVMQAQRDRLTDADALFKLVRQRTGAKADPLATAIATSASAVWIDKIDARTRVEICRAALQADGKNAFLHYFLGQARAQQQDTEGALQEWRTAASIAPAWGLPPARIARGLLGAGRIQEALAAARAAQSLAPRDEQVLITLAMTRSAVLGIQPDDAADLLSFMRDIRTRFPDSDEVRPLLVNLLARIGKRDEALAELHAVLDKSPRASETTMLQLATVSRVQKLGVEAECFEKCAQAHGMTSQLAYQKALWLASTDHTAEALASFEGAMSGQNADAAWQLAHARLVTLCDDTRAKAVWIATAEAFPHDTLIQWAALTAAPVQDDHEFLGRTIDRLREELGEDNVEGRLAQAYWMLQGNPSPKDTSEATVILSDITRSAPNMVEPRLLLASCLQQLGNLSGAVEQMQIVVRARPDDSASALRLVSLLIQQGDQAAARDQLQRLAQNPSSPAARRQAAALYLALGDRDHAAQLMEQDTSPATGVMLAQLYVQQNQMDKAEELCRKLMAAPTPEVVQFTATLLASQGRRSEAEATLRTLDTIAAKPGVRELIHADFLARFGKPDEALAAYRAAVKAAPGDAAAWRQVLLFSLRAQPDLVREFAVQAAAAVPGERGFAALHDHLAEFDALNTDANARALFPQLLQNTDIDGILQAIQLAYDHQRGAAPVSQTTARVRQLAESKPRLMALQLFAAQFLAASGQYEAASTFAQRAMEAFPSAADAARVAAGIYAGAGRWKDVATAAGQWRQRDASQAPQADVVLASASLHLGDPSAGLRQLAPYMERALKDPDTFSSIIMVDAQCLFAAHHADQAVELLRPLLARPQWRNAWMNLAGSVPDVAGRALWLDTVSAAIPASATIEKIQLAACYQQLAALSHDPAHEKKYRDLMDALENQADMSADNLVTLGLLLEMQRDPQSAEKAYRRALSADPNQAVAANNLAMLLVNADRNLDEAGQLASRAVSLAPKNPSFYDTQATVMARQKAYDKALESIANAIKLEPANAEWKATRIFILGLDNRLRDAKAELQQLKSAGAYDKLSESTRKRLVSVDQ